MTGELADAKRLLLELETELDQRLTGSEPTRLTLGDYARLWLERKAPELKPSTAQKYLTDLEKHILPELGARWIDELRSKDVACYLASGRGSANNRRNRLALLRQLSRDSLADGFADVDWVARVRAPAAPGYTDEDPHVLTAEQLGQLLAAVPAQWSCMVYMLAMTGLRWGEVSALKWDDVDLRAGLLRVRRGNWKGQAQSPKTAAARRTVPLVQPLPELLRAHRHQQVAEQHAGLAEGWVFPSASGKLYRGTPLRRVLEAASTAAGTPRIRTHDLRRTWNNLARQVAAGQVVRAIVGHTSEAMTEHYSHVGIDERRAAAEAVAKMIPNRLVETCGGNPVDSDGRVSGNLQ